MKDHRKERTEARKKAEKLVSQMTLTGEGFPVKIRCCSREKTGCSGIQLLE